MPPALVVPILKRELVTLLTKIMTVFLVIPESDSVQGELLITLIRVETRLHGTRIMDTNISKEWGISWYNKRNLVQTLTSLSVLSEKTTDYLFVILSFYSISNG